MLTTVIGQHTSSLTPRTLLSQINLARMDQLWWRHSMENREGIKMYVQTMKISRNSFTS
jgi:hypothetical protein